MHYTLAIDSGNSHIKWGFYADDVMIINNCVSSTESSILKCAFMQLPEPDVVIISHVSKVNIKSLIAEIMSNWASSVCWLRPAAYQCGVRNGYVNPLQLGSDRWAALIAAWNLYHKSCLVINVGTAMTIDAISNNGEHLGGIILPSSYLMTKCLVQNTNLHEIEDATFVPFATNTQDAMYSGVILALLGAIDRMYYLLTRRGSDTDDCKCIISGGGAHVIIPYLRHTFEFVNCLVLNGLLLIANEIRSKNPNYG